MRRIAVLVLFVTLAANARAQESGTVPSEVQPGARVRMTSPGMGMVTGRVIGVSGDSLSVVRDRAADTVRLGASALSTLDLSTGRHKRRGKGAAIGFASGAVLGAVVGAATYRKPECSGSAYFCDTGRGLDATLGAVGFGAAGAIVGAIVGAGTSDSWRRVLPRQLGAALRF